MSNLVSYSLVLLLGFVAGWLLRPMAPTTSIAETAEPRQFNAVVTTPDTGGIPAAQSALNTEPLARDTGLKQSKVSSASPLEITSITTFAEYLDFIRDKDARELHPYSELISSLYNNSEFIEHLLTGYIDNDDSKIKQRLKNTIVKALFDDNSGIENNILNKIRTGSNSRDWLGLLSQVGVRQEDSLRFLSEQIPQLYEEQDIAAAIDAISVNPRWIYNPISQELRNEISDQIAQYIDFEAPVMRKAVLRSLANFPRENGEAMLLEALDDSAEGIQQSALKALMHSKLQSKQLEDKLLHILEDKSHSEKSHALAYHTLIQYSLEGKNYDRLRKIALQRREAASREQRSAAQ